MTAALRCAAAWLASPASDAFLGRDASGAVIMKRQQDMPAEAFVPCDEAVAMLERGDRSILALSYGWLTALHPDPRGTTLAAVRRFLDADAPLSRPHLLVRRQRVNLDGRALRGRRPPAHLLLLLLLLLLRHHIEDVDVETELPARRCCLYRRCALR